MRQRIPTADAPPHLLGVSASIAPNPGYRLRSDRWILCWRIDFAELRLSPVFGSMRANTGVPLAGCGGRPVPRR
jgi:hypothetical protein